jgi:hypothetical protein
MSGIAESCRIALRASEPQTAPDDKRSSRKPTRNPPKMAASCHAAGRVEDQSLLKSKVRAAKPESNVIHGAEFESRAADAID